MAFSGSDMGAEYHIHAADFRADSLLAKALAV
jgi:hypothetical protein